MMTDQDHDHDKDVANYGLNLRDNFTFIGVKRTINVSAKLHRISAYGDNSLYVSFGSNGFT